MVVKEAAVVIVRIKACGHGNLAEVGIAGGALAFFFGA